MYDACGGFVQIAAEKLEYQSVISALRAGRFYWSMGPELRGVSIKDNVLSVTTSPVQKIFVLQEGRDSYKAAAAPGETLTFADGTAVIPQVRRLVPHHDPRLLRLLRRDQRLFFKGFILM